MKPELTDAQEKTLAVLADIGGWATHSQIVKHGGYTASARALERAGLVECREGEDQRGFFFAEWRLLRPLTPDVHVAIIRAQSRSPQSAMLRVQS